MIENTDVIQNIKVSQNIKVIQDAESGFVALFFVLSFASALGFLVLSLSLKSQNMLRMFQYMKDNQAAREAADFCLQKLLVNKVTNIGYVSPIDVDIRMHDGLTCRYESFVDTPEVVARQIQVQRGVTSYSANSLFKSTVHIRGIYVKSGTTIATTSHKIIREFYITDSL